jgi:hypothetical protein
MLQAGWDRRMSERTIFWLLTLVTLWVVLETFDAGFVAGPGDAPVSPETLAAFAWPALSFGWAAAVIRFRRDLHRGYIILGALAAIGLAAGCVIMLLTV